MLAHAHTQTHKTKIIFPTNFTESWITGSHSLVLDCLMKVKNETEMKTYFNECLAMKQYAC